MRILKEIHFQNIRGGIFAGVTAQAYRKCGRVARNPEGVTGSQER
jgi:hypothetical protein